MWIVGVDIDFPAVTSAILLVILSQLITAIS
jgi:hypothetical protein